MKFTCLSKGGGFNFPPSHVLNICGFRVLFDVPLDLSALTIFSPVPSALCSPDSDLVAEDLIRYEPWYKTLTSLQSWDVSSIDVVLVSNPMGILGLPFLTRAEGFSAEIFATEATVNLGRLLLEDLVSMNMEFRQFYGARDSGFPPHMNREELDHLPSPLKDIALGKEGLDSGSWLALYSAVDVKDCIRKISSLRHAEETCFNGTLVIKALCSGLEIGSCNWVINSPKGDIAFLSGSVSSSAHAMSFDHRALEGSDLILFSDFSSLHGVDDAKNFTSPDGPSSPRSLYSSDDYSEEKEKLGFVCSCAIDAVKTGGSVLVPINRIGTVLQLLEQMSTSLEISDLKIPIYFISSTAKELLAFTNIIPEWLCKDRQEKLFSGEDSFAHTALLKEKKLYVFPVLHSPELLTMWREPCIVFSPSWSLRLGPAVPLLQRWCGDPNSLLVLENGIDAELALLPYKPMEMKVLQCSFLSGIKMKNVLPLLEALQPKQVLLPGDFKKVSFLPKPTLVPALHFYEQNKTLRIARLKTPEVEIPMDLATQFRVKKLKNQEHVSVARLKGELVIRHGKHELVSVDEHTDPKSRPLLYWGSLEAKSLLSALLKMGIKGTLEGPSTGSESDGGVLVIVSIREPFMARIQIRAASTIITTTDNDLALKLAEAVCSTLGGI